MRATSIAARAGLALGLFLAWTPVNAEQSFPAEPEQSFPTEPEQPFAFEPVPVRRWRASAAFTRPVKNAKRNAAIRAQEYAKRFKKALGLPLHLAPRGH